MDSSILFPAIILSLIFSAFFSGMEIAFISSNRLKVELDKTSGTLIGKVLGLFYRKESSFIALLLLGNNIALVIFGIAFAGLIEPTLTHVYGLESELTVLLTQTVISTLIVLFLAEFLPKAIVQINPNRTLRLMIFPMLVIYLILYIPTLIVMALSSIFLRLLKADQSKEKQVLNS